MRKTELTENGNFRLFAAKTKNFRWFAAKGNGNMSLFSLVGIGKR
jgi:hypothetical protein